MMRDGGAARRDGSAARALARLLTPAGAAVLAFAAVAATGTRPAATDGWRLLPAAPAAPNAAATAVWTGSEIVLFGRRESRDAGGAVLRRVAVADAYDPVTGGWRRLAPPAATASFAGYASVWTGRQVIVWGQGTRLAFDPRLGTWRRLARSRLLAVHDGFALVAWTGRELVGWGGGCCGDAFSDGVAYEPATGRWRALARAPLAGSQHPIGAWTGRELLVLVGSVGPDGRPWPARLARAAAYDPATDSWRRIAPPPVEGGTAAWDGRELLVVGAGVHGRAAVAYDPGADRWRRLAPLPSARFGSAVLWTGRLLLVVGGGVEAGGGAQVLARRGLAYDPRAGRWSVLARAPLRPRLDPVAVWTGKSMLVWGGDAPRRPPGSGTAWFTDGAAYTPPAS